MNHGSKRISAVVAVAFGTLLCLLPVLALHAQDKGEIKRAVLTRDDLSTVPGHEGVESQVELAPGASEGKHTHPGELFGFVREGTLTLNVEGKPPATLNPGQGFFVPANTVHWGENQAKTPCRVVATLVVPKGKPLTTPAK